GGSTLGTVAGGVAVHRGVGGAVVRGAVVVVAGRGRVRHSVLLTGYADMRLVGTTVATCPFRGTYGAGYCGVSPLSAPAAASPVGWSLASGAGATSISTKTCPDRLTSTSESFAISPLDRLTSCTRNRRSPPWRLERNAMVFWYRPVTPTSIG